MKLTVGNTQFFENEDNLGLFSMVAEINGQKVSTEEFFSIKEWAEKLDVDFKEVDTRKQTIIRSVAKKVDAESDFEFADTTANLKTGDKVLELDGCLGVVCHVYDEKNVSLCIDDYDTIGDMIERDSQTSIHAIAKLIK